MPDIDIDFLDRDQALKLFKHISASRMDSDRLVKHNTGVYLHEVPMNAVEGICAVPYDAAEELKYFKIDFLNVGTLGFLASVESILLSISTILLFISSILLLVLSIISLLLKIVFYDYLFIL